jgi:hypothetical protein
MDAGEFTGQLTLLKKLYEMGLPLSLEPNPELGSRFHCY